MKIVLDTNVLISAFITHGHCAELLEHCVYAHELMVSEFILAEFEDSPDRWVDLQWREGRHPAAYSTMLHLTIRHDAGVLGRICTLIGAQGANISNLEFITRKSDFYRIEVDLELRDHEHLHNLLTALEAESDVAHVERIRDPALKP